MGTLAVILILVAVIVIVSYMFIIMPRCVEGADMELVSTDYAHGGLWDDKIPKNSLSAFRLAADAGYGIELCIQLSRDGKIVVFGDRSLKRICGVDRRICDMTFDELRGLRLCGTQEIIPTLGEVLRLIDGRVPLMLEIRADVKNNILCRKASGMLDNYRGAFCVESPDPGILAWFKEYRPRYARGQIFGNELKSKRKGAFLRGFALSNLLFNFRSRPDFIVANMKCSRNLSFVLCTSLFRVKGFVRPVRTSAEYGKCRSEGRFAVFERFRP